MGLLTNVDPRASENGVLVLAFIFALTVSSKHGDYLTIVSLHN